MIVLNTHNLLNTRAIRHNVAAQRNPIEAEGEWGFGGKRTTFGLVRSETSDEACQHSKLAAAAAAEPPL